MGLNWLGPQTAAFINAMLKSRPFPEQAYRSCLGVLSLAKKYPHSQIELAAGKLWKPKYSHTKLLRRLDWLMKQTTAPVTEPAISCQYPRP